MSAKIYVLDYAAGAKGGFCIMRPMPDAPPYSEFWTPQGWVSAAHVFTDEKLAFAVRNLLAWQQEHGGQYEPVATSKQEISG